MTDLLAGCGHDRRGRLPAGTADPGEIRVPDSVEFSRGLGLDVERGCSDGLADLLVTTCYFQLNPWQYSVELGHKYGVSGQAPGGCHARNDFEWIAGGSQRFRLSPPRPNRNGSPPLSRTTVRPRRARSISIAAISPG